MTVDLSALKALEEKATAGAQAIYELREKRNFPPDGHVSWRDAPQSVRDYNCDLARACLEAAALPALIKRVEELEAGHDQDLDRLERAADSLDKYKNVTERAGHAIDKADAEIEALWHYSTCPYDHCERCIRDDAIIKEVRDRMAERTIANSQFGVGA